MLIYRKATCRGLRPALEKHKLLSKDWQYILIPQRYWHVPRSNDPVLHALRPIALISSIGPIR